MKIEKYEFVKNNYYNIYLSNGEVITLNEKVITKNELLLKKELTTELYDKLIYENSVCEAENAGIKYISIRLRSIKEVRDYLYKKKYLANVIDSAICNLLNNGYLDDNRFSKAFIKDKLSFTNKGDYKIRMELSQYGVDSNIIEKNMAMIDDDVIVNKIRKIIDTVKERVILSNIDPNALPEIEENISSVMMEEKKKYIQRESENI